MKNLVQYDNEKDLRLLVDDSVEFITSETKRIIEQDFQGSNDPNNYILVSQNITLCFVMNVLMKLHLNNDVFMRSFRAQADVDGKTGGNHLPVNGSDFFKGMRP